MAGSHYITFGTTKCLIQVRKHVDFGSTGPFPSEATAFANGQEVTENGRPVERIASTDEEAFEAMCSYLERRFGPRGQ